MKNSKVIIAVFFLFFAFQSKSQQIFKSEKYKFSIIEPTGWEKELNRPKYFILDNNSGRNIVTYKKYKRSENNEINPTINISVENTSVEPDNFIKKMLNPKSWKEHYYLTMSFAKEPSATSIDGRNVIYGIVNFTYNSHGTTKKEYRKRIYYLLSTKKIFKIVFIDDQNIESDTKLFDSIINSMKIDLN